MRMNFEYAIIVKNKTRLEALVERFNTKAQAKFYIESLGGNFGDYELEHDRFYFALDTLQTLLTKLIKYKLIDRPYLPSYIFSEKNLIIVIGQDGLVANTAKYSNGLPIVAINPDEERYDGILLPFNISNCLAGIERVLTHQYTARTLHFAEARLNDGQRLLAFNDLFIGANSHISARYKIGYNHKIEEHSSSGIIVSTQAGSTGWLSSIFNMAYGITGIFEKGLSLNKPKLRDDELLFVVREPFKSIRTQTGICAGKINQQHPLRIESYMPEKGVIFSDGIENDYLSFNSGATATIGLAKETANLVVQ